VTKKSQQSNSKRTYRTFKLLLIKTKLLGWDACLRNNSFMFSRTRRSILSS
jgi:hypothetical protein